MPLDLALARPIQADLTVRSRPVGYMTGSGLPVLHSETLSQNKTIFLLLLALLGQKPFL